MAKIWLQVTLERAQSRSAVHRNDVSSTSKAAHTTRAALETPCRRTLVQRSGSGCTCPVRLLTYLQSVDGHRAKECFQLSQLSYGLEGTKHRSDGICCFVGDCQLILLSSSLCWILKLRTLPCVTYYFALMLFIF